MFWLERIGIRLCLYEENGSTSFLIYALLGLIAYVDTLFYVDPAVMLGTSGSQGGDHL